MEQHTEICRDLKFWESFLDQMAENRFNLLSLWNVHPFSYMVKPANFPHANDFSPEEMAEWKEFWTALFRICRARAIEPFIVNWNIAVSPEFARHYNVLERNDTSGIVKRYTREVVTQVIDEYPDLAGIGITLADWMSNFRQPGSRLPGMSAKDREDWIAETVVAGMKQASRPVKFLHRSVLSADPGEMQRVIDEAGLPDTTLVEIKFNWSHGHSSPRLLLTHDDHSGKVENRYWSPMPNNYRIQDMEDYLREEAKVLGRDVIPDDESEKGYYFRSDHFNFARIGIPALYLKTGSDFIGKGKEYGSQLKVTYTQKYYHQPSDEFDRSRMNFEGGVEDLKLLFQVGKKLSFNEDWPKWKATSEFRAVRESYMK